MSKLLAVARKVKPEIKWVCLKGNVLGGACRWSGWDHHFTLSNPQDWKDTMVWANKHGRNIFYSLEDEKWHVHRHFKEAGTGKAMIAITELYAGELDDCLVNAVLARDE